jgi:NAD(P)-dependent dehydrogenase (short-subunit alcohol dehydrogenase family)
MSGDVASQPPEGRASIFDMTGTVAIVTGGFSGLGLHFARTLALQGCAVAMCGRRIDLGRELARELRQQGRCAEAFELDVTDHASVQRCVDAVEAMLGAPGLLLNNAGIAHHGPSLELAEETWSRTLQVNLDGVWTMTRAFARRARAAQRPGNVLNIASILGLRVAQQVLAYSVAKAGVIQMTKALALELAQDRIRVNALAPGYFQTDLNRAFFESEAGTQMVRRIPLRRLGRMRELDGPLLLLASEASSFMTGSVVCVDGGHLASSL